MKRVLITGITGFAGSHLAEYLLSKKEYKIVGTYLLNESLRNVERIRGKIRLIKVDLTNAKKVLNFVEKTKPDLVFNLAGLPSTADSFKSPKDTLINNISLEINLLSAIKENNFLNTKILVVSSADIYGLVKKEDLPIDEETPFMPTNPYSVSKIAQDFLGLQYFLSYDLQIVRVRPFNHIGPRQSTNFVVASISKTIAEIEKGKRKPILTVGNLNSKRDFTDVRDMVRAYVVAIEKGEVGNVYNIGSGVSYKISDIIDKLLSLSKNKIKVVSEKSLLRPVDNPDLVCDARKFSKISDWKPEIKIETSLKNTLDYWRNMV